MFPDFEVVAAGLDFEELVKAFGEGGELHAFAGGVEADGGNAGFAGACLIAFQAIGDGGIEVIAYDAIAGGAGGSNIAGAFPGGGIGVVHDEIAPFLDELSEGGEFTDASFLEVETDAGMGGCEAAFVERAFARTLQADQDRRFHNAGALWPGSDELPDLIGADEVQMIHETEIGGVCAARGCGDAAEAASEVNRVVKGGAKNHDPSLQIAGEADGTKTGAERMRAGVEIRVFLEEP